MSLIVIIYKLPCFQTVNFILRNEASTTNSKIKDSRHFALPWKTRKLRSFWTKDSFTYVESGITSRKNVNWSRPILTWVFFRHWWQSWSYDFFFIRRVTELATKDFARGRQEEQDLFLSGKLLLIESLVNSDAKAEERVRSRILACSGLSGILSPLWRFFQHPLTLLDGSISGLLWGRNMFLRLWWLSCVFVVLYIQFYFWTKEAIRSRSMSYT